MVAVQMPYNRETMGKNGRDVDAEHIARLLRRQKINTGKSLVVNEKAITYEDEAIGAKPASNFDVCLSPEKEEEFRQMEEKIEKEYIRLRNEYIEALPNDGWAPTAGGWGDTNSTKPIFKNDASQQVLSLSSVPATSPTTADESHVNSIFHRVGSLKFVTGLTIGTTLVIGMFLSVKYILARKPR